MYLKGGGVCFVNTSRYGFLHALTFFDLLPVIPLERNHRLHLFLENPYNDLLLYFKRVVCHFTNTTAEPVNIILRLCKKCLMRHCLLVPYAKNPTWKWVSST